MSTKRDALMTEWRRRLYADWRQLAVSSFIIALGISLNNVPIVVGGLLIVPLLDSIMKAADALVNGSFSLLYKELIRFSILCFVVVVAACLAVVLLGAHSRLSIFSDSTSSSLTYFMVAFVSGWVATALQEKKTANTWLGFVLGMVLVPPLVFVGMGLGLLNMVMVKFYGLTFLLNLVGTVMGGSSFLLSVRLKQ